MPKESRAKKPAELSYQDLTTELQTVVADLESGELDIDTAVQSYARGLAITKQLEGRLSAAENIVKTLQAEQT